MDFFSYQPADPASPFYLEPFGLYHWLAMGFFICLAVAIVVIRKAIRASDKENIILTTSTLIAIFFEISLHVAEYFSKPFHEFVRGAIPIELCAITLWLAVILCATKWRFVFELLYFWGLGAVASLLFADNHGAGPDRFRYYQYFTTHGYTVLVIVYFAAVRGYRIGFRSLVKAVGILFPITLAVRFLDLAFSGKPWEFNYMFLLYPPDVSTPIENFGSGWSYYFAFIGLCTALMVLAWLPWGVANRTGRLKSYPNVV